MASLINNNGTWYLEFCKNKRRKKFSLMLEAKESTRRQALKLKEKYEYEFMMGLFDPWKPPIGETTIREALRRFLRDKRHVSRVELYRNALSSFTSRWSPYYLHEIEPGMVQEWYRSADLSVATRKNYLRHLKGFLSWCVASRLLEKDPLAGVKWPKLENRLPAAFSPDQVIPLIDQMTRWYSENRKYIVERDDYYLVHVVRFAIMTGCRLGEICNLTWSDVDFSMKTIRIRNTKTREADFLPIHAELMTLLQKIPRIGQYVHTVAGDRLDSRRVSKRFKFHVRAAGLSEDLHFHSLRHTAGYWMANAGMSVEMIRRVLRHKSITMSQHYIRVDHTGLMPHLDRVFASV